MHHGSTYCSMIAKSFFKAPENLLLVVFFHGIKSVTIKVNIQEKNL